MGSYATTTSISELLPQYLAGNTTTSDTAGTNIFSRHVDRAEGIVTTYIASRYDPSAFVVSTTTTNVPPIVRALSEDLASWWSIRGTILQGTPLGQEREAAYKRAWEVLDELKKGEINLTYTTGSSVPARAARFRSSTDGYSHIFHLDDPRNWKVDRDQVDDIADTRD